jgi:hypothetical protein
MEKTKLVAFILGVLFAIRTPCGAIALQYAPHFMVSSVR